MKQWSLSETNSLQIYWHITYYQLQQPPTGDKNQHFQRFQCDWIFSDVLNIFGRPFHLTVVLKLQQQRCRAFLASVHSVLRTTLFLCTMKRMNMIPSPKKAVTSHKAAARRLQNLQKSKIKMTCHNLRHKRGLNAHWSNPSTIILIPSKSETMLQYFWFWSVTLPPKTQSPQWQIAQCARNHPWWPDGNADHDQANAKLGFESNGTNDPLSLPCQLIWVPPVIPSLKIPFAKHRRAGCTSGPSQVWVQSWRKRVRSGPLHWSPAIKPGNPTREQYPENSVGELAFHSILSWKSGRCCWSPEDVCHWHAFLPSTFMAISATRTEYGIRTPWACQNGQSKQTKIEGPTLIKKTRKHWIFQTTLMNTPFAWRLICRSFSQLCAAGNSKAKRQRKPRCRKLVAAPDLDGWMAKQRKIWLNTALEAFVGKVAFQILNHVDPWPCISCSILLCIAKKGIHLREKKLIED